MEMFAAMSAGQLVGLGATALGTISQIGQGIASANQDKDLAKSAIEAARLDEQADRRRSAEVMAKQQAGAAAAGLDIGSGTPLELLMDSAFKAEMNALNIRRAGRMESDFYKTRAKRTKAALPGIAFQGLASGLSAFYKK